MDQGTSTRSRGAIWKILPDEHEHEPVEFVQELTVPDVATDFWALAPRTRARRVPEHSLPLVAGLAGIQAAFAARFQQAVQEAVTPLEFRSLADRVASLQGTVDQLRAEVSARPYAISIHEAPGYRFSSPLTARVDTVAEGYVVSIPELDMWIDGFSESEAIEELKTEIADLANDLFETPDDNLGPDPLRWKRALRRIATPQ